MVKNSDAPHVSPFELLLLQTLYSYNVNKTKQNGGQDESKINHNMELNTEGQQQQHEPH